MRFLIIWGLVFLNACRVMPQSKNDMININSISVYKDFQERGYTTAGAFTHFDDMKKDGTAQLLVDNENKEKLEMILGRAEKKKHYQTKHGGGLIFCELQFDTDTRKYHRVIISGIGITYNILGNIKEERMIITDLTKMIDYKITNREDLNWLSDFTELIKK
jgi:hypothetical protein